MKAVFGQTVSAQANLRKQVKSRSDGRSQNRPHVRKALVEYLSLGRLQG